MNTVMRAPKSGFAHATWEKVGGRESKEKRKQSIDFLN